MKDFFIHFSFNSLLPYMAGILLITGATVLFFFTTHRKTALLMLLVGAFALRMFMIRLDPYLHMWDEQYHAMVAKNMMKQPFKPMLYKDPVLPYEIENWTGNHIWLHKQPQFLWQMAFSMKIFGASPAAARFPSALLSALMVLLIFSIGRQWMDETTGFLGALLFSTGHYLLELVAGVYHTEHNDVAFIFYVTASLWAYTRYHFSRRRHWVWVIGFLAAMAVLNKWLTGLLVYLFWGMALLSDPRQRKRLRNYTDALLSLALTIVLALPWQVYIHLRFPEEAHWEAAYNTRHFFEVLEGHGGNFWYHFAAADSIYGKPAQWLLIPLFLLFTFRMKNKHLSYALLVSVIFVYLFFSAAATKMPAFTLILAAPAMLSFAYLLKLLYDLLRTTLEIKWLSALMVVVSSLFICLWWFDHKTIVENHSLSYNGRSSYVGIRTFDNEVFRQLPELLPDGEFVLFNCRSQEHIQIMFESRYLAYVGMPGPWEIAEVRSKGYRIAVFNNYALPDYILNDTSIIKLETVVWKALDE